jgi:hypothetical protein
MKKNGLNTNVLFNLERILIKIFIELDQKFHIDENTTIFFFNEFLQNFNIN